MTPSLATQLIPNSALSAPTANAKRVAKDVPIFRNPCYYGIYTSDNVYLYRPQKVVRLGYPGPSRRLRRANKSFREVRP